MCSFVLVYNQFLQCSVVLRITGTLVLGALSVQGVPSDYSPFPVGHHPKSFRLRELKGDYDSGPGKGWHKEFRPPSTSACRLTVVQSENGLCRVRVFGPNHRLLLSQAIASKEVFYARVYAADLNKDGLWDYLVVMPNTSGCGLAAEISYLTFLLSSPKGYAVQTVLSYCVELRDFVDLNGDGKPEFLHSVFVFGEAGKDGRTHNYWVHNLLTFSGTNFVSANNLDSRFPRWVWYTFNPNHRDTDQLTAAQRKRLWLETWGLKASIHGRPMLPDPEALADEQSKPLIRTSRVRREKNRDIP